MFFSKTINSWKIKQEEALLKKKEAALKDTLTTAFFGFLMGFAATLVLSAIFYGMMLANQQMLEGSSEIVSTSLMLLIGYNLPIYFLLLFGIVKMLFMTFNSLWILLRFAFVKAQNYDLENEPSFRI